MFFKVHVMTLSRRQLLISAAAAPLAAPRRPNVLLILADGLPAGLLGCYGNKEIRTPAIDLLARLGTRFQYNFACTPSGGESFVTLLSGRVPRQQGAKEVLLPGLLAGAGYKCGFAGNWPVPGGAPSQAFSYTCTLDPAAARYQDAVLRVNGERVQEEGYLAAQITRRAVDFIDQQTATTPFFLTVSHLNPQPPYDGHPLKYYEPYKSATFDTFGLAPMAANAAAGQEFFKDSLGNLRKAAAAVAALDDQIPPLLKKLRDKKLDQDTLIVFTSLSGALLGRHGLWGGGLASDPANMFEESVRVPMMWSWPGKMPVDGLRPEVVSLYDFLPTVAAALGLDLPASPALCGRSYLNLATGKPMPKKQVWTDLVFGQIGNTEMARDTRYKLVVRNGGDGPNELYDVIGDRNEKTNQYDNPEFISVRDRLANELGNWRKRYA